MICAGLLVPDLDLARVFYNEGLGLTPDPDTLPSQRGGPFVTWYNIGRQQLHIIKGPAQNTHGAVLLKVPDAGSGSLRQVARRLATLHPVFEGTAFGFTITEAEPGVQGHPQQQDQGQQQCGAADVTSSGSSGSSGGSQECGIACIDVTDPWGQRFRLVDSLPGFPWAAGIAEVQLPCFAGTAHLIARFYSKVLGARVVEDGGGTASSGSRDSGSSDGSPSAPGGGSGAGCRVFLGPGSCLSFVEDPSLGEPSAEAAERLWSGWHVAFYIAAFAPAFRAALDLGINLLDHPYRDKSPDLPAALAHHQFRFKDIVHLDAFGKPAGVLYCAGHEVRSLHHPGYLRPLSHRRGYEHE